MRGQLSLVRRRPEFPRMKFASSMTSLKALLKHLGGVIFTLEQNLFHSLSSMSLKVKIAGVADDAVGVEESSTDDPHRDDDSDCSSGISLLSSSLTPGLLIFCRFLVG